MSTIANLAVVLTAKVGGFATEMDKADKAFQRQAKAWDSLASNLTSTGAAFTASVTAPILGAVGAAAMAGDAVTAAMANIRIGTGATGDALDGLRNNFETVAKGVPNDLGQVSTAIADLNTRLGLTGKPLEDLSTQFLNLSRITGTDVATNIRAGTRVMGDWDVATEAASSTMDMLFKVSQTTGIAFGTLGGQLVQFGAPLRQMGFDLDTSAALLGKFEQEGVNAELVMGSMRIALSKMAKEGITDSKQALESLVTQIQATESPTERVRMAMELFGTRAGPDMAAAIAEGRFSVGDLVDTIANSQETINRAAVASESFGEKWGMVRNNLVLAIAPLGEKLLGALDSLMPYIIQAADFLGRMVDGFLNLPAPVLAAVGAIAGVAAAAGPVLLGLGGIISAITTVMGALAPLAGALGVGVAALSSWGLAIAAAVAALAALGAWIYGNWEPIKAVVLQAWDGLAELWTATWKGVTGALSAVWQAIAPVVNFIWGPLIKGFVTMWNVVSQQWITAWNTISGFLGKVWNGILSVASTVWKSITDTISSFFDWARRNIPGMEKILTLDKAWDGAKALEKAQRELGKEVQATAAVVAASNAPIVTVTGSTNGMADAAGIAAASNKALATETSALTAELEKARKELDDLAAALTVQHEVNQLTEAADKLNAALIQQSASTQQLANTDMPAMLQAALSGQSEIAGLTVEIEAFGEASADEIASAKADLTGWGTHATSVASGFRTNFTNPVRDALTSTTDGVMGAIRSLATGEINSLADLGKRFGDLGKSVLSNFRDVVVDAIMGPQGVIAAALNPLIGKLTEITSQFFGIGGSAAGGVAGAAGGGAGSGIGSIAGGLGSAAIQGITNMVTGIVTSLSSVFSNIQQAQGLTKMTLIEENTRWLKRGLVELPDSLLNQTIAMLGALAIIRVNTDSMHNHLSTSSARLGHIRDAISHVDSIMNSAARRTATATEAAERHLANIWNRMQPGTSPAPAPAQLTLNITVGGETTTVTAPISLNQQVTYGFSV